MKICVEISRMHMCISQSKERTIKTKVFNLSIDQTDCYFLHCSQKKSEGVFPTLADFHLSNSAASRPEGQESLAELERRRQKGNPRTSQRYPDSVLPKLSPSACSRVLCRAACSAPNIKPWQSQPPPPAGSHRIHHKLFYQPPCSGPED